MASAKRSFISYILRIGLSLFHNNNQARIEIIQDILGIVHKRRPFYLGGMDVLRMIVNTQQY